MTFRSKIATGAALAALAMTTAACTTDPDTGQQRLSKTAIGGIGGALGGYLLGDLVGGRHDRTEKIVGAGIGGVAGAAIGAYMDKQERELRQRTAGTDVQVIRQGDDLLLNIPSGVNFAHDSATVEPRFQRTLDQVAGVLSDRQNDRTYVDVYGHTDFDRQRHVQSGPVRTARGGGGAVSRIAWRGSGARRDARFRHDPADRLERDRGRQSAEPPRRDQDRTDRAERHRLTRRAVRHPGLVLG